METALAPLPGYLGTNPVKLAGIAAAIGRVVDPLIWLVLVPAAMLAAVASLVLRFRRSRGDQRQQLKLLASAGVLLVVPFVVAIAGLMLSEAGLIPHGWNNALELPLGGVSLLAMTAMPVAAGVAILKYHLYDVDRLITRTLVYGLLTTVLGAAYAGVVLVLGQLSGGIGAKPPSWSVATATLAVAALFQPARHRIQQAVDRRFNRRKYNAAMTIELFSACLREQVDLDTPSVELLAVVDQTMQPTAASLWLRPSAQAPPSGAGRGR